MSRLVRYGLGGLTGGLLAGALAAIALQMPLASPWLLLSLLSAMGTCSAVLLVHEYRRTHDAGNPAFRSIRRSRHLTLPARWTPTNAPDQPHQWNEVPGTELADSTSRALEHLTSHGYVALVGANNSGKTYLLRRALEALHGRAMYVGPARFASVNILNTFVRDPNEQQQRAAQASNWLAQARTENTDGSPFLDLPRVLCELSQSQWLALETLVHDVLGQDMALMWVDSNRPMSPRFVAVDGYNLSFASSGFRLLVTLLAHLLDSAYDTFLIDEPELGISPDAQSMLADLLSDPVRRRQYFPHVRTVVVATHSGVFLDRRNITNNYTVTKEGSLIQAVQVCEQSELAEIHFRLLGNRFEDLYLPSLIVLVEGQSDERFLRGVLRTRYPDSQISVVSVGGDSRLASILAALDTLVQTPRSPYAGRILAVLDAVHAPKLRDQLVRRGVPDANIVEWEQNGIEFYYPCDILESMFGAPMKLELHRDSVAVNGQCVSKTELAVRVSDRVIPDTRYPEEFERKLLDLVGSLL